MPSKPTHIPSTTLSNPTYQLIKPAVGKYPPGHVWLHVPLMVSQTCAFCVGDSFRKPFRCCSTDLCSPVVFSIASLFCSVCHVVVLKMPRHSSRPPWRGCTQTVGDFFIATECRWMGHSSWAFRPLLAYTCFPWRVACSSFGVA